MDITKFDNTPTAPRSGVEFKTLRTYLGMKQQDVAAASGLCRQRLTGIEKTPHPSPRVVKRYLAALTATIAR